MKKYKVFTFLILIFALILGFTVKPSFSNDKKVFASSDNYYFTSYEITINVKTDNSYDITESVNVHYNSALDAEGYVSGLHKGWVRAIPLSAIVKRVVGDDTKNTSTHYDYEISNVTCSTNNLYSQYSDENYKYIEFGGDDYVNAFGPYDETYTFSYNYKVGYDYLPDVDEFYFNLHGTQHSVNTENFKFTINMPKDFDASKIYFYKGEYGENNTTSEINFDVNGNVISNTAYVETNKLSLLAGVGLTIRVELPSDYFSDVDKSAFEGFIINIVGVIITVVCGLIIIFICLKYSGKNKPVVTVEFYPPENITPPDGTYILNGSLTGHKMVSLILYWASKGYVKINLDEDNSPVSVTKVKNLPENSKVYEKEIFNSMFATTNVFELDSYNYNVATAFNRGAGSVGVLLGKRYTAKSMLLNFITSLVAWVPLIWTFVLCFVIRQQNNSAISIILIFIILLFSSLAVYNIKRLIFNSISSTKQNWLRVLNIVILVGAILLSSLLIKGYIDVWYLRYYSALPLIIYLIFGADILGYGKTLLELEKEIKEYYGKLMGLKNNIVKVEYEKMRLLLNDDPSYFYDLLPYAYALGVMDEFVKNFEQIAILPNEYFGGVTVVHIHHMTRLLNHTLRKTITPPSTSSGGGRSGGFGGGFSGGGSGGGGSFGR